MSYHLPATADKIKFAREGGAVQRTHSTPGIGDHSVARHSFNMLTLLLILKPDASAELMKAIIMHDVPERLTGDMPHPAKRNGIQNNQAQEDIERVANIEVFGRHSEDHLTDEEERWLSGLDMLEFYCYCKDQLMIGNYSINIKKQKFEKTMKRMAHLYPVEILNAYNLIERSNWETVPDLGDSQ